MDPMLFSAVPLALALASTTPCEQQAKAFEPVIVQSPLESCDALLEAARKLDFDTAEQHVTRYTREHFGLAKRWVLRAFRSRFATMRCVRVNKLDESIQPELALVQIYAPQGRSREIAFIFEDGAWRFDDLRFNAIMHGHDYSHLHQKKAVAQCQPDGGSGPGAAMLPAASQ